MNTEALRNGYKKLYEDANIPGGYKYGKKMLKFENLSHFVGMAGEKYFEKENKEVRLLIVGRAPNGWEQMDTTSAEAFAKNAVENPPEDNFSWIVLDDNELRNNETNEKGKYYYLNRSPFWRVSKEIWKELFGKKEFIDKKEDKWVDHIAWTNLYKVAPKESGNPTQKMCDEQLEACREILKAEIEEFKPKHILFITGYEWWFKNFEDVIGVVFEEEEIKTNVSRGPNKNSYFVEAYNTTSDGRKVVVACRPEGRDESAYVKDVIAKFNEL